MLGARGKAKVLMEASTESEWVARCLEELGHEVVVADPNFAPMYGMNRPEVTESQSRPRPASLPVNESLPDVLLDAVPLHANTHLCAIDRAPVAHVRAAPMDDR